MIQKLDIFIYLYYYDVKHLEYCFFPKKAILIKERRLL